MRQVAIYSAFAFMLFCALVLCFTAYAKTGEFGAFFVILAIMQGYIIRSFEAIFLEKKPHGKSRTYSK